MHIALVFNLLDPRNFLIAADEKDKQSGKGKTEKDGAQPSHSKDTEKKATDPVKGMGEKFLLIQIVFSFSYVTPFCPFRLYRCQRFRVNFCLYVQGKTERSVLTVTF
jgi:hypothetical protein